MAESIDIETPQGQWRQELNSRMRALLEAPPFEPEPEPNSDDRHQILIRIDEEGNNDDDHYYLMEADLYNSARQGEGRTFLDVLEGVSRSDKVHINRLLKSVSLTGDTVLHVAASTRNSDLVDLIITHFPSLLNKVNLIGDTAVHVAAKAGKIAVLRVINNKQKEFLNSGSLIFCGLTNTKVEWKDDSLKATNKQGNTPLHEALINRHENLAVELVEEDVSVSVVRNVECKSAFYLAVEAGYIECLELMMEYVKHEGINLRYVGKSPMNAAILGKQKGALKFMLEKQPGLINLRDDDGRTPLHFAALMGYNDGVMCLIEKSSRNVMKRDKYGQLPIHLASTNGHINVIEQLLKQHYNPAHELLNRKGQNILHVAAESGKYKVVCYILKLKHCYILKLKHSQELKELINQKDDDGNMPLHLATMNSHPKIVCALTWFKRVVDLDSTNNDNLTALDVAQSYKYGIATFRQRLTWSSLKVSGASLSKPGMQSKPPGTDNNTDKVNTLSKPGMQSKPPGTDNNTDKQPPSSLSVDLKQISSDINNRVNTLLLVSTLIITVTFAAGFTIPRDNSDSVPNMGSAKWGKRIRYPTFVICDTAAMFTSLLVAFLLICVQGDISMTDAVLRFALPILGFALYMMAYAFLAGVSLSLSRCFWLLSVNSIIAIPFLIVLILLFVPITCLSFTPRSGVCQITITAYSFMMT